MNGDGSPTQYSSPFRYWHSHRTYRLFIQCGISLGKLTYIPIWKCPKCSFNMLHCIFYATHVFSVQMPVCCICSWVSINTQDMDYKNWWNQTPPLRGNHYLWWDREVIQNIPLGMRHVHEGAFRSVCWGGKNNSNCGEHDPMAWGPRQH